MIYPDYMTPEDIQLFEDDMRLLDELLGPGWAEPLKQEFQATPVEFSDVPF